MDALTKAQENFLRGCLNEMDCELRKSRARNPNAQTYGKYGIYDREGNRWLTRGFVLTFEEAEDSFIRMVAERGDRLWRRPVYHDARRNRGRGRSPRPLRLAMGHLPAQRRVRDSGVGTNRRRSARRRVSRAHSGLNRRRWATVRRMVLDRDGWRCQQCGRAGKLEVDHVRALEDGGDPYDMENLQTLCRSCHVRKTAGENRTRCPVSPEVQAWRDLLADR